jgi:hypothetical protein
MDNNNYAKLKKLLTEFETYVRKTELKTDELCELGDRINSLQDFLSEKESTDSEEQ